MSELLPGMVVLPLAASLLCLLLPRWGGAIGISASVGSLGLALWITWAVLAEDGLAHAVGGWQPGLGIALRADGLSAALLVMSATVVSAASVYATAYFSAASSRTAFWPVWLMLVTALYALLLAGDVFNIYVTLELLGLTAVSLVTLSANRTAVTAATRYLTIGLLGSLSFLLGVLLLYAAYGTLDIAALSGQVEPVPAAWVALVLMTVGLLVKSALFPLHFWLPGAHANAPAPVSAALSALVVKAAYYLLVRLWFDLFGPVLTPAFAAVLGGLGAVAVLWGSWQALRAPRLKLLAAYSTVAQLGYLFLFLPLLLALPVGPEREIAFAALVLFAITHGFAKSAFFLGAGVIQQRAGHDRIAELGGTARALPVTTFVLALAGVALVGLPPSGTFLAKWQLLSGAIATGQWVWVPFIALGSLLAGGYLFRLLGHAFGPGEGVGSVLAWGREELPALILALLATAVLGLGAFHLWDLVAVRVYPAGVIG